MQTFNLSCCTDKEISLMFQTGSQNLDFEKSIKVFLL